MKILKYILIILCVFIGLLFPVMGILEPCLDENMQPSSYIFIPHMGVFITQVIMGIIIGIVSGWLIWFCISWLKKRS
jgi:uncharacterized membrane protein (DUF106 family)